MKISKKGKTTTRKCLTCGKSIKVIFALRNRKKFCSKQCYYQWLSKNRGGKNHHYFGKRLSRDHRDKLSKSHVGLFVGNKSVNWKGGITALGFSIRNCYKYRQWRSDVFTRDDFTCQECGKRSGNGIAVYLEAHHSPKEFNVVLKEYDIKTLEEALCCDELWNINNGQTLCVDCHNKTKRGRK